MTTSPKLPSNIGRLKKGGRKKNLRGSDKVHKVRRSVLYKEKNVISLISVYKHVPKEIHSVIYFILSLSKRPLD